MNRRQRKKHRVREFAELGFYLRFTLPPSWTDDQHMAFWDRGVRLIESLGLAIGGGTGEVWDVFVAGLAKRATVGAEQRAALEAWLTANPDVSALFVGPLVDAWHEPLDAISSQRP